MEFLNTIWIFFQDQILGMKWLNLLIGDVLSVAGVDIGGRLGGSIQFFLYDVVKITILLCLLIFMISYIQSYFLPKSSGQVDGIVGCRGRNPCSPAKTEIQDQAKKENRRRNLRISGRLRRRMGRDFI